MMYIILFENKHGLKEEPIIGYLPIHLIPKGSVLRKALFDTNYLLKLKDSGIEGIYEDIDLAREHLKLEREWRGNTDHIWMVKISRRTKKIE